MAALDCCQGLPLVDASLSEVSSAVPAVSASWQLHAVRVGRSATGPSSAPRKRWHLPRRPHHLRSPAALSLAPLQVMTNMRPKSYFLRPDVALPLGIALLRELWAQKVQGRKDLYQ